jgi:hypothetical protein
MSTTLRPTAGFGAAIHDQRLIGATIPSPITRSDAPISIVDSVLTNCDLTKVNQRVVVDDSIFIHCNLEGAVFAEATLKKVSFKNCNFTKLSCVDAILFDTDMRGCTLSGADFSHTSFKGFTCDANTEQWEDTLLWGTTGLTIDLPSCYSDTRKWIPGLTSALYKPHQITLGLSREWLLNLSHSSGVPVDTLLALYNEHPEVTPRAFASLVSAVKGTR